MKRCVVQGCDRAGVTIANVYEVMTIDGVCTQHADLIEQSPERFSVNVDAANGAVTLVQRFT